MSDLPTREEALRHAGVERHDPVSFPVLLAYADGRLIDRESIDYEPAAEWYFAEAAAHAKVDERWSDLPCGEKEFYMNWIKGAFDATLWPGGDDE